MDILGFVFVVTGLIAGHHYGYIGTGMDLLRTAYRNSLNLLLRMEDHYTRIAARRIVLALTVAAVSQSVLLVLTTVLLPMAHVDWYDAFFWVSVVLIAGEVIYALYQRTGIPHVLINEAGAEVHWPDHLQNEQGQFVSEQGHVLHLNELGFPLRFFQNDFGQWVDPDGDVIPTNAAGRPFRYRENAQGQWIDRSDNSVLTVADGHVVQNGQPINHDAVLDTTATLELTDRRIPHPLARLAQLDPAFRNALDRVSTTLTVSLILVAFTVIGVGIMTVGIQGKNSLVFLLGAICIYAMLTVLQLLANVIAWFFQKTTKVLEFISTIVTEGGLVTLPGIKWSNIKQVLPGGVDYLDEEHIAAVLRAFPLMLAMHITPFVAVVWMWTDPFVATFVLALLTTTTIVGVYLSKNGGSNIVANRKFQLAIILFYVLPGLMILFFVLGAIDPDLKQVVTGQMQNLKNAFIGYGTGSKTIAVNSPLQNLGAGFMYFVMACVLGITSSMLKPTLESGRIRRFMATVALPGLAFVCVCLMLMRGYGLVKNIDGETTIGAPTVDVRTPAQKKAAEATAETQHENEELKKQLAAQRTSTEASGTDPKAKKPPVRYAHKAGTGTPAPRTERPRSRSGTGRGELSPEFLALERSLESSR